MIETFAQGGLLLERVPDVAPHRERQRKMLRAWRWRRQKARLAVIAMRYGSA
jgi:hypothetical protein